jgi:hypothetical protein
LKNSIKELKSEATGLTDRLQVAQAGIKLFLEYKEIQIL